MDFGIFRFLNFSSYQFLENILSEKSFLYHDAAFWSHMVILQTLFYLVVCN